MTGSQMNLFLNGTHGPDGANGLTCQQCHGGRADFSFETMEQAHEGMDRDPSAHGACDGCHADIAASTDNSLHTNLWGEKKLIETRGNCTFEGSGYESYFDQKCNGCHTTCGQCHVSRPNSVGGGFPKTFTYLSHNFQATPHMTEQCTACHGSRIGTDFLGDPDAGIPADVHQGMRCEGCHTAEEIHGDDGYTALGKDHYEHRYEVATMPRCEDCHDVDLPVNTSGGCADCHGDFSEPPVVSAMHLNHAHHVEGMGDCAHCHRPTPPTVDMPNMQCQVCHSRPYKNCTNCHNLVADERTEKFDIDPSVVQFKIAHNPRTDTRGEYDYVVVRHVPVDPGTYSDWGLTLPGYLDEPTWKYTSPHNIRATTDQTTPPMGGDCYESCHGSDFYLKEIDLRDDLGTALPDYQANISIVIDD